MLDSDDSFTVLVWAVGPTENEIAHTLLAIFLNSKKFSGKNPHLFLPQTHLEPKFGKMHSKFQSELCFECLTKILFILVIFVDVRAFCSQNRPDFLS